MSTGGWVCLMYHDVVPGPRVVPGSNDYFSVPVAMFEAHLDQLRDLGFEGCTVEHALAMPGRRVGITFDDGDVGQFAQAFPALARRGMTGTFFVTTSWVGRNGYVSWDGLREMKAAGMSIQSHTRTHPYLSELGLGRLRDELHGSREDLNEKLNQQTKALSFPGGDAPRAAWWGEIKEAGYTLVASSHWGVNRGTTRNGLPWVYRCTVAGSVPPAEFRRIAEGDPRLGRRRVIREAALRALRRSLGPSRYLRWRNTLFDALGKRA